MFFVMQIRVIFCSPLPTLVPLDPSFDALGRCPSRVTLDPSLFIKPEGVKVNVQNNLLEYLTISTNVRCYDIMH